MKVYKVGDRVQIQPLASDREKYGHPRESIMDNMLQYSNKQATIVSMYYNGSVGQHVYKIHKLPILKLLKRRQL